ncbi:UDP-N-acetylmuramoyl-tripeptide--D-alanyl-D-alanine ligase [bacterium]|nr:UDP-N-acetylmuramoyl-tripeptide--D-alanyl-D-alanine ligase [bacterium]
MLISTGMLETAGIRVVGNWDEWLPPVKIDSRQIENGDLFWALPGERVDGHDYVATAFEAGAKICAVSEDWATQYAGSLRENAILFVMPDPLKGLQALAMETRRSLGAQTIALTGSNGKTTTRELLVAGLKTLGRVTATKGNFNNHIGLPLTILNATGDEEYLVLEMGANHVGEIDFLCQIGHPESGLITNIGDAHVGEFGGFEMVQKAKGELFDFLAGNKGLALVNLDDERVVEVATKVTRKAGYTLGLGRIPEDWTHSLYLGEMVGQDGWSRSTIRIEGEEVTLRLIGAHWARAALAAAAMAMELGGDASQVVPALADVEALPGRGHVIGLDDGVELLDDSYNANVASIEAAVRTLVNREGARIAVIGDVMELGEFEEDEHRRIGRIPDFEAVDHLVFVGERMSWAAEEAMLLGHPSVRAFVEASPLEIAQHVASLLEPNAGILVKGSRKVGLERVVDALRGQGTEAGEGH